MSERFGDYILEERLGAGGMAVTWRAREQVGAIGDRFVALKQILPEHANDDAFRTMFLDEVRITSLLRHRNVCTIYRAGELEGQLFMALEYIDGAALSELRTALDHRETPFPTDHSLWVMAEVLDGLYAAHTLVDTAGNALQLVHRDVSPQNVMIARDGAVKLIDFGIAKAVTNDSNTRTGAIKGKVLYLSPEQLEGKRLTAQSDIFSAGLMLYELLTGTHPLRGDSEMATLYNFATRTIPSPLELVPDLPPAIAPVVMRALERDLMKRWQTAREFADALREVLQHVFPGHHGRRFEDFVMAVLDHSPLPPLSSPAHAAYHTTANGIAYAQTNPHGLTDAAGAAPSLLNVDTEPVDPTHQVAALPPAGETVAVDARTGTPWLAIALVAVATLIVGAGLGIWFAGSTEAEAEAEAEADVAEPETDEESAADEAGAEVTAEATAADAPVTATPPAVPPPVAVAETDPDESSDDNPEPQDDDDTGAVADATTDDDDDADPWSRHAQGGAAAPPATQPAGPVGNPPQQWGAGPPKTPRQPNLVVAVPTQPTQPLHSEAASLLIELKPLATCLNRIDGRIRDSHARYLSWVSSSGPTCNERIVYGLYSLYDDGIQKCAYAAGAAEDSKALAAIAPTIADLSDAVAELVPLTEKASRYWDGGYRGDDCKWGKENHSGILSAFEDYSSAADQVSAAIYEPMVEAQRQYLDEIEARDGKSVEWHARAFILSAQQLRHVLPLTREEAASVDMTLFRARYAAFEDAAKALLLAGSMDGDTLESLGLDHVSSAADSALGWLDDVQIDGRSLDIKTADKIGDQVDRVAGSLTWVDDLAIPLVIL